MTIQFLLAGSAVRRFHTIPTIQENTVGHHSHGVAMLLWELTRGNARVELIMAGLSHDLGEQAIGDIPSPSKRAIGSEGMAALDALEEKTLFDAGLQFILTEEEKVLLKMADCLDGMLFCISERRMGNKSVIPIFERFRSYIYELPLKTELLREIIGEWRDCHES